MLDRRITLLRTLSQVGTMTEAAELTYRSTSGYSRQLRSLADELGVELLEQVGRQVRLTPAAVELVKYADAVSAMWESTRDTMADTGGALAGEVVVGAHPSAISALITPRLEELRSGHPALRVRVHEAEPPGCFNQLLVGEVALCVTVAGDGVPPPGDRRFSQHRIVSEPLDALVPSTHAVAGAASVELAQLAECDWVLPPEGGGPGGGTDEVRTACRAAGFVPRPVHLARDTQVVADLVEASGAVSLTSRFARYRSRAVRVPLAGDPVPARNLVLWTRSGAEHDRIVGVFRKALGEEHRG